MKTETKVKQLSRCKQCWWIHEADSTAGTSFRGVGLCQLHAAAPELLEALKELMLTITPPDYTIEDTESYFRKPLKKALSALKLAEG